MRDQLEGSNVFPDTKLCHVAQLSTSFGNKGNENDLTGIYVKVISTNSSYIFCRQSSFQEDISGAFRWPE